MSNHLVSEVLKREVGKMSRTAVMMVLADKASDDGSGIWASKQTIADELGCTRQTVIDTIAALVGDGLLAEVGQRTCPNGYTTEYQIKVENLEALPLVPAHQRKEDAKQRGQKEPVKNLDGSKILTGQKFGRVKNIDATRQNSGPHPSKILTQTPLEPPLNHSPLPPASGGSERVPFPEDWILPKKEELTPEAQACAMQWPDGAYEAEGEAFANYRRGRGDKQHDWVAIWAARVVAQHQHVMRGAKAGIKTGTGAGGRVVAFERSAPAPAASKSQEDAQSVELHRAIKAIMGDAVYERWIEPCALLFVDDGLRVIAPSTFTAARIEEKHGREIERALIAANITVDWHRVETEKPAKKGKRA